MAFYFLYFIEKSISKVGLKAARPLYLPLLSQDFFDLVYDVGSGALGDGITLDKESVITGFGALGYSTGPGTSVQCGIGLDCAIITNGITNDFSQDLLLPVIQPLPISVPLFNPLALLALAAFFGFGALRHISKQNAVRY